MTIFAIGDSHSIFYHNSNKIKEHWVSFAGLPLTWHQLINRGLDIYNVGTKLGNGHEKYNIKSGDFVLFCYGWNDIQKNIYKYAKDNYKSEIERLINKYGELLKNYKNKYIITPIIQNIMPNPLKENMSINGDAGVRNMYIKYANQYLFKYCKDNNILFFNIYDLITDENGYLKNIYTKDKIHLDYDNVFLRKTIDTKLINLVNQHTENHKQ